MRDWQPIDTAPKDKHILLFGMQRPMPQLYAKIPQVFSGYWDNIDEAWCSDGSTWEGPFYDPTHWMPLPEPPKDEG